MAKAPEIPFAYGHLVSITGTSNKVVMWFQDHASIIRGILVDLSDPSSPQVSREEVMIRRKTEGQTRKKKLPPVGHALDTPTR